MVVDNSCDVDLRRWGEDHIHYAIKQVDDNTWVFANFILKRALGFSESATWNDEQEGANYTVTKTDDPIPATAKPVDSPHIRLVRSVAAQTIAWRIGKSGFLKIGYWREGHTLAATTINWVREKHPSFPVPEIFYCAVGDGRVFTFMSRLPGRTLNAAWPTLDNHWKRHYISRIADICEEMVQWKGERFGGVDGGLNPDAWLSCEKQTLDPEDLMAVCKKVGMDCSDLVFFESDMIPEHIIVEHKPVTGSVGIVGFAGAGIYPRDWLLTKCTVGHAMYLGPPNDNAYGRALVPELRKRGFKECRQAWLKHHYAKHEFLDAKREELEAERAAAVARGEPVPDLHMAQREKDRDLDFLTVTFDD